MITPRGGPGSLALSRKRLGFSAGSPEEMKETQAMVLALLARFENGLDDRSRRGNARAGLSGAHQADDMRIGDERFAPADVLDFRIGFQLRPG